MEEHKMRIKCPNCHKSYTYKLSGQVQKRMREMELEAGRPCVVWIGCLHCPVFLEIDFSMDKIHQLPGRSEEVRNMAGRIGIVVDLTFTEEVIEMVDGLNKTGDQLMRQGNPLAAKAKFEEAIRLRKHEPQSWYNLGVYWLQARDLKRAEEAFRHATRFDDQFVNAWNNLGMVLVELNRLNEADACFDKGINVADYAKCYYGKGLVALKRGDIPRAHKWFTLAAERGHNLAGIYLQKLGRLNPKSESKVIY
jgi:tetratricopeptide (TPR) repeat protein